MNWDQGIKLLGGAGWKNVAAGLGRMTALMDALGNPQDELRFVHIAGTNGKGSAAAMLSSVLTAAGLKTGRYISPHLIRINERFSIDGTDISDSEFSELAGTVSRAAATLKEMPTSFELLTALGFLYFHRNNCDIVVLEVGMGGRFDATNVIRKPLTALIMNIGLEHTEQLGNTLEKIAFEKAGIIKNGCDVVLYSQTEGVEKVISDICKERGAALTVTDAVSTQPFSYRERRDIVLSLPGVYQLRNAAVVLDTLDILIRKHGIAISEEAIRKGLKTAEWPGRFQTVSTDPFIIIDGAHNPNGVEALAENIAFYLHGKSIIFLMGVMEDKDHGAMLDVLGGVCRDPENAVTVTAFIAVSPESERALPADILSSEISDRFDCPVSACTSVREGLELARTVSRSVSSGVILAFGSLYQAGEILDLL